MYKSTSFEEVSGMTIFTLNIEDKKNKARVDQIWNFIDVYMGESGLEEIKTSATMDDFNNAVGSYVLNATWDVDSITGVLISDDNFYNLIDGIYMDDDGHYKKITGTMRDPLFDIAVKLVETIKSVDPYADECNIVDTIDQLKKDPIGIINFLCNMINDIRED